MENLLQEILEKLDSLEDRIKKIEKDMDFLKLEATSNNVSIKGMEKLIEDTADKVFNIYDFTRDIKKNLK